MTSIEFHYRPSTRIKRSKGSVYIRVIHRRETCSVTIPRKIYPEEWDKKQQKPMYAANNEHRYPFLFKLEEEMKQIRSYLEELIARWEFEGRDYTAKEITAAYRRRLGGNLLIDYVDKLCKELRLLGQERTARAYLTTRNRLLVFTGNNHLQLKEMTGLLVRRFEMKLQSEGKSPNTISFYMRNLRAIYNKAISEGLLETAAYNPFELVYTGVHQTKKRALTAEEMKQINELDILKNNMKQKELSEQLEKARKLFLFCFYARGMSFVDMAYLKKENIKNGFISYRRKKTGQLLEIKIDSAMRSIIRYFESETKESAYVFPVIDLKKKTSVYHQYESGLRLQNKHLKRISTCCGIQKNLSTHVARHSWATIAKEKNIPLIVISEGLGHTSERTTSIYLGSLDRKILDRAGEKVAKAIKTAG